MRVVGSKIGGFMAKCGAGREDSGYQNKCKDRCGSNVKFRTF